MMYHEKLVACIKVDGQILRESEGAVTIPFGSEYSVLLKNLDSRRVQVKVSIDGTDATEGTWLVLHPNSSLDLERYIRNGNLKEGNRFKFIARTQNVEKHRGIKAEDGLVRVEYKREKVIKTNDIDINRYHYYWYPYHDYWYTYTPCWTSYPTGVLRSAISGGVSVNALNLFAQQVPQNAQKIADDLGITVPGSLSQQEFHSTSFFPVHEQSDVIVLKLCGAVGGKKVSRAVTVKSKPKCMTCGKTNKSVNKFCSDCGTALTIL